MRHITISLMSVFVILPAFAGVNLPMVNIASGGVSARSAFGDVAPVTNRQASVAPVARAVKSRPVVARVASNNASVTPADVGQQIVASTDVLMPRRPSADLWAKSDNTLRMPMPSEFSVIRTDTLLPEESLDQKFAIDKSESSVVARETISKPALSEIDNQIARLSQLQQRADASVKNVSPRVIVAPIAQTKTDVAPRIASADTIHDEPVSLRRMVVPMSAPDVVVRSVEKNTSPRITAVRDDMAKMTPAQLRQAFRKTFLSENKHLSTYPVDDRFDVASDMSSSIEGFTARRDLSEAGGIRALEIKINFRNDDSSLSRDNYNLLTEYAGIVLNKPTRAVQIAIPQSMTTDADVRKLAARRLAIVEQVLTDNGISKQRIMPVLSSRNEQGFVLRMISNDEYETLTQQKTDMFGDTIGKKTYKSMSW